MAKVFLTTTADNSLVPTSYDDYFRVRESAEMDKAGRHELVADPEKAEIILFVGSLSSDYWDVRRHPLVLSYPDRCFMYHSEDHIFPFLPGVYPSIKTRDMYLKRAMSGGYSSVLHIDLPFLPFDEDCPYLFSFCGSFAAPPFRRELGRFKGERRALIIDTSAEDRPPLGYHAPGPHRDRYIDVMRKSKFVLCPRGRSLSSWRLFETLRVGRVPVIIADGWSAPQIDTPWEHFSVRLRESDVHRIPAVLAGFEAQAPLMASTARKVWEEWFCREVFFSRIVDWCLTIKAERPFSERVARWATAVHLVHPYNLRHFVLPRLKKIIMRGHER